MKNILLTGKPGCGKTTIIKKVLEKIKNLKIAGFFTEEIREGGERKGFKILSLDGQEDVMAHVDFKSQFKVGKYGVNIETIEDIGADSLIKGKRDADIIIIDEIGKMELFSDLFKLSTLEALDSRKVLGTITKARNKFIDDIKKRDDITLIEVTKENRDKLADEIAKIIDQERRSNYG